MMASPGIPSETAKASPVSCREKRQPWQGQMTHVDFQLSLLAKYAGIEFHPQVLEIILDLVRMNVSIPMLAKMIRLMCAQKAVTPSQEQAPNSVKGQNGNSNGARCSIPTMEQYRTLIVSSSASSSESAPTTLNPTNTNSNSSGKRNADLITPSRPNPHSRVTTRAPRAKTAPRFVKK